MRIVTLLMAAGCITSVLSTPAPALDLARAFAHCTGRYSALMEHQWLIRDPASRDTEQRRKRFADLIEAVVAPGQGAALMAMRIEAKMAQAALLFARDFSQDQALRHAAARASEAEIAACEMLLLQG